MTFGKLIAEQRKKANLSQKELAAKIKKEDGEAISAQYLNDIEHGRRNPPNDFILKQLADLLDINLDLLYVHAGELPEDLRSSDLNAEQAEQIKALYEAFRRTLRE
jgi:transcriptional regulator with XRE-family HTH domain